MAPQQGHDCRELFPELEPFELTPLPPSPLVSVLIPNFNYADYIPHALDSLITQTYPIWEAIICDDGSTDDSRRIVSAYARRDRRIHLVCQSNAGVASALNAAFARARGDIIALLDSDDLFHPKKLEVAVTALRRKSSAGAVAHRMRVISECGDEVERALPACIDQGWIAPRLLQSGGDGTFPPTSGLCFRSAVTSAIFPLPLSMQRGLDAYLIRCAAFMTEVVGMTDVLGDYRMHNRNITAVQSYSAELARRNLEDYGLLFDALKIFLRTRYGETVARRFTKENSLSYPYYLLVYYLWTRQLGPEGLSPSILMRRFPLLRRRGWSILLALPQSVGRRAFNIVRARVARRAREAIVKCLTCVGVWRSRDESRGT